MLNWRSSLWEVTICAISAVVFIILDFLDLVLCLFFRVLDEFLEGKKTCPCYCCFSKEEGTDRKLSESLGGKKRRNVFRELLMGFVRNGNINYNSVKHEWRKSGNRNLNVRWSDCGCESCVSWMNNDLRLHVVVREPNQAGLEEDFKGVVVENVVFLHGFLSSSSFWTETVFPHISKVASQNYRLFAIDLLGFGRSPKPSDCFYTLKDHIEMIEKSLIHQFQLNSFHIVAHSMGCVMAIALAAKHTNLVKSITLIAPPYFSCTKEDASLVALERLAARRVWPPLLFGSSFMSWYEHLGRCVCYIICRNHRIWEWILKLLTWRRDLPFTTIDLTRHTHHSAWHTMHNVICGGAKLMDKYLEILKKARVKIEVIQGSRDELVPLECSDNIKMKVPYAEVKIIANEDHSSVVIGRSKQFTNDLEKFWASIVKNEGHEDTLIRNEDSIS